MAGAFCPAEAATATAYVPVWGEGDSVTAIGASSADNIVRITDIPVGNLPLFLAPNPSGTRVYVPNRYGSAPMAPARAGAEVRGPSYGLGNVSVIDTATNAVTATIEHPSFNEPYAVAVSPDGGELWVVNFASGNVSIFNIVDDSNEFIETISSPCGLRATGIAFNPVRPEAYVVADPDGLAVCFVSTSASHDDLGSTYLNYAGAEYAVVTPDGSKIYVTGDAVSIIDTATRDRTEIFPIELSTVTYLAVSNDGTKVYAAGGDAFLEIIDSSNANYTDDDFTDSYVDFSNGSIVNAVAVVPGTNLGLVTDAGNNQIFAFDTSTDGEILNSDILPIDLNGTPKAIVVVVNGLVPGTPPTTFTFEDNGLGNGWFNSCGMVVGRDGKGPMSTMESAGMIALYFALLLLPVGILKLVHGRKRFPFEKTGIVALFVVASMLVASSAHAVRLIAPKAQRFHPTTDGQGALTVETDQTLGQEKFNFGVTLSGAKKTLNMGDIKELQVQKVIVDELYTADLTAAYGLTPGITLGLDVPVNYSSNNLNYDQYQQGNEVRDDSFYYGDIRVNAKFRVMEGATYGLALIPFVSFPSGDKDYLLSQGQFCFGIKGAGHLDVSRPLTLYANLGAEHIGTFTSTDNPEYYTPWIQYGVGAKYLLPWRKDSIVAEVNGETTWATPFSNSTTSPIEFLAAYRTEVTPGWTLQAGGGGGLNKGMGAPQWRAILGIGYKM